MCGTPAAAVLRDHAIAGADRPCGLGAPLGTDAVRHRPGRTSSTTRATNVIQAVPTGHETRPSHSLDGRHAAAILWHKRLGDAVSAVAGGGALAGLRRYRRAQHCSVVRIRSAGLESSQRSDQHAERRAANPWSAAWIRRLGERWTVDCHILARHEFELPDGATRRGSELPPSPTSRCS